MSPRALYRRLAEFSGAGEFPWERTHLFWGDERFVPPGDARSNARMVEETLLAHLPHPRPIPRANVHPIPTEGLSPADAAHAYERTLRAYYGAQSLDPARPLFDVVLLGLGPDGHTASLFPCSPVLEERGLWAAAVTGARPETRITLTYPALESTRAAFFLVTGEEKRAILARFLAGADFPASRLRPLGELRVFADRAAARPA